MSGARHTADAIHAKAQMRDSADAKADAKADDDWWSDITGPEADAKTTRRKKRTKKKRVKGSRAKKSKTDGKENEVIRVLVGTGAMVAPQQVTLKMKRQD